MRAVRTIAHGAENVRKRNDSYDRNSEIGRGKIKVSPSLIMEYPPLLFRISHCSLQMKSCNISENIQRK